LLRQRRILGIINIVELKTFMLGQELADLKFYDAWIRGIMY